MQIALYKNAKSTSSENNIHVVDFFQDIRDGKWQDLVIPIRAEPDKAKRRTLKEKLPAVTLSGIFAERKDSGIKSHSGLIGIDIDDLNTAVEGTRDLMNKDPYVYSVFTSVSGTGLCVVFRIEGERHRDAFQAISKYLLDSYRIIVDKSGVNEGRLRYISYDPQLSINDKALKFKKYLPKLKEKKIQPVIYVKTDFDVIIDALVKKNVPITEDYRVWIAVGYALVDAFGVNGVDYFHALSAISGKYDRTECEGQYKTLLRADQKDKPRRSDISLIYDIAKSNNIDLYSEETKRILSATTTLRKGGLNKEGVIQSLEKFEGITKAESEDIVNQAFDKDISLHGEDSIITEVERWLKYNHSLKRNCITRRIENDGVPMQQNDFNSMFLDAKKQFDNLTYDLFEKILFSNNTQEYNPLLQFFEDYKDRKPTGVIDQFWSCFHAKGDNHISYFGTKWLISIISAVHGEHSPLMLIFAGAKQGTGKTEALRRLLPKELRQYYAESKLDAGKDDEILMTQKLLIMDDEMGGKSKAESKRLKELTSKQTFSLREPYGRNNVDLNRLAVLCGTTNDLQILNDPTGNRRLIPVEIISVNQAEYNKVDKVDLFMEAYWKYKEGFEWQLNTEDIKKLNKDTEQFEDYSTEYELIQRYLNLPSNTNSDLSWSCSEIKVYLEKMSNQRLSLKKLGQELKRIGFISNIEKVNGKTCQLYTFFMDSSKQATFSKSAPDPFPFGSG